MNNWIKTALIEHAIALYHTKSLASVPVRVIDFGCGKGGDLDKWMKNKSKNVTSYVGVDYAKGSLVDFAGRVASMATYNPTLASKVKMLVFADMGDTKQTINTSTLDTYSPSTKEWVKKIPCPLSEMNEKFTIASCQFAMHYMFQDIERANHFFKQVSTNLHLGGVLIATTVDSRVVADQAVRVDSEASSSDRRYKKDLSIYADREDISSAIANNSNDVSSEPTLMMNLHFDEKNWSRLLNTEHKAKNTNAFGIRYVFKLAGAVDVPEWLVPTGEPLQALAAAHGMQVELCQNFHDFVFEKMNMDASLRYV